MSPVTAIAAAALMLAAAAVEGAGIREVRSRPPSRYSSLRVFPSPFSSPSPPSSPLRNPRAAAGVGVGQVCAARGLLGRRPGHSGPRCAQLPAEGAPCFEKKKSFCLPCAFASRTTKCDLATHIRTPRPQYLPPIAVGIAISLEPALGSLIGEHALRFFLFSYLFNEFLPIASSPPCSSLLPPPPVASGWGLGVSGAPGPLALAGGAVMVGATVAVNWAAHRRQQGEAQKGGGAEQEPRDEDAGVG